MIIIACKQRCELGEIIEGVYFIHGKWIEAVAKVVKESNYESWKKYRADNNLEEIKSAYPNESFYYEVHTD